jgi:2-haloalkanoic acid dehalogenase type II
LESLIYQGGKLIKVIAFDVFGTVFDLSGVDRQELRDYAHHLSKPEWSPLHLPKSWEHLPAHSDSAKGISKLREKFIVVTCSNGPLGLLTKLSKNNGIQWDAIIPLEMNKVFKTNPRAYMTVCETMEVEPSEVMMVTANEKFGDLEASAKLGMTPMWIRGESTIPSIIALADVLNPEYKI